LLEAPASVVGLVEAEVALLGKDPRLKVVGVLFMLALVDAAKLYGMGCS